jgi:hypothetical protein
MEAADALPTPPTASAREAADTYRRDLDEQAGELADHHVSAVALPAEALQNIYVLAGIGLVSFQPRRDDRSPPDERSRPTTTGCDRRTARAS